MLHRILFLALSLCLSVSLAAQSVPERTKNRAENRAKQRSNQKIDRKVDEAVDEAFNSIGNLFKKKKKKSDDEASAEEASDDESAARGSILGSLGMGGEDWEPYTNDVSFSLTMRIVETKKNGKTNETVMKMAALPTQSSVIIDDPDKKGDGNQMRMILNTQDGKTTMVTTDKGETSAYRMRMPNFSGMAEKTVEDVQHNITITATGNRKTVNGYACEEYLAVDQENGIETRSWVTDELNVSAMDLFSGMVGMFGGGQMKKYSPQGINADYQGIPIESTSVDEKGRTYVMTLEDIKVGEGQMDKSAFDLTGIQVQEVGF